MQLNKQSNKPVAYPATFPKEAKQNGGKMFNNVTLSVGNISGSLAT